MMKNFNEMTDVVRIATLVRDEARFLRGLDAAQRLRSRSRAVPPGMRAAAYFGKCFSCRGYGTYVVQCSACDGAGRREGICKRCEGRKTIEFSALPCRTCDGSGKFDGKPCRRCGATGIFKPAKTETCRNCNGVGRFNTECWKCKGDKKLELECKRCAGSGWWSRSRQFERRRENRTGTQVALANV